MEFETSDAKKKMARRLDSLVVMIWSVVGIASLTSAAYAGHIVDVPEPNALSLLGLVAAVLIVARVRHKQNNT